MDDRIYTPPQLAKRWSCDPARVVALIKRGALRAFTLSPPGCRRPRWRITEEAVREFEAGGPVQEQRPRPGNRRRKFEVIEFF